MIRHFMDDLIQISVLQIKHTELAVGHKEVGNFVLVIYHDIAKSSHVANSYRDVPIRELDL